MRKLFFVFAMSLAMVACNTPIGEFYDIANIPGVEPGRGVNNYNENTTYQGALLPLMASAREDMVDILKLIGTQKGDIDDALFLDALNNKVLECEERFMYIKTLDGSEEDQWTSASEWIGGQMCYDLSMYGDNTFVYLCRMGSAEKFMKDYLATLGYYGWKEYGVWSYDAENDMLYTDEERNYAAQVLYLDGEIAILLGHVYPMWIRYKEEKRNNSPMELYCFRFKDGKESFTDGYVGSIEEYRELMEEYRDECREWIEQGGW